MVACLAQAQQQAVIRISALPGDAMVSAPQPVSRAVEPAALFPVLGAGTLRIAPSVAAQRTADRRFWTLVAVTAGSAVLDGETTMHGLQQTGLREMNPLLGSHPDRARFYATVGAGDTALAYLAYHLKRTGHEKLWRIPLVGAAGVHLGGGVNNLLRF